MGREILRGKIVSGSPEGKPLDVEQIRRALSVLVDPEGEAEVRCLRPNRSAVRKGNDLEGLLQSVQGMGNAGAVYLCLNPVSLCAPCERSASDQHVTRRRWLFLDVDSIRPKDVCATAAEKEAARATADGLKEHLTSAGWPEPVEVDSGNGYYLLYRIDLPNDEESALLCRRVLHALADEFPGAKVDRAVHNASRIARVPGTWNQKGRNTVERPHRLCRLLSVPETLEVVSRERLEALAGGSSSPEPESNGRAKNPFRGKAADSRLENYARNALRNEMLNVMTVTRGSQGGDGANNALNEAAFSLGTLLHWDCLSESDVVADLTDAARRAGLDEEEIGPTIQSGLRAGKATPRKKPAWAATEGDAAANGRAAADSKRGNQQPGAKTRWEFSFDGEIVVQGTSDEVCDSVRDDDDGDGNGITVRCFDVLTMGALLAREFPEPEWVIKGILSEGLNILAGAPKQGKAQPLDEKVLTPSGYRPMGELTVGSEVVAADGSPAKVIAVHPQGMKEAFRVSLSDGSSVEATGDHLWQIRTHTDLARGHIGRVMTTDEVASALSAGRDRHTYVPMCQPVRFAEQESPPVSPYLLGVLLGDGNLVRTVCLSYGDDAILACIADELPEGVRPSRGGRYSYLSTERGKPNPLLNNLRSLGVMGKRSYEKEVPAPYLTATPGERFALLQGLLDTDGTVTLNRCGTGQVSYASTSFVLAGHVAQLVESLGGTARIRQRQTYASKGGIRKPGRPSKVVIIRLPSELGCPFRLPAKVKRWAESRPAKSTPPVRRIVAVESIGMKPCQCITIDRDDGLYLTAHCVVTHNSMLALNLALTVAGGGKAMGDVQVSASDVLYLSLEDKYRRVQARSIKMLRKLREGLSSSVNDRLSIVTDWPRQNEGGLKLIDLWARRVAKPGLVIIDVWNRFSSPMEKSGNAYSHDADAMGEVKKFVDRRGFHSLIIHHTRKPGMKEPEDFVNEISGTLGLSGSADGVLVLMRARHNTQASLHVTGRDVGDQELVIEFDEESLTWRSLGKKIDHVEGKVQQKVKTYLQSRRPASAFVKDIASSIGEKDNSVRAACVALENKRVIRKVGNAYSYPGDVDDDAPGEGEVPSL